MIKRFIIAFVLLVLVGGGLVGFNLFRDQAIEQFFANMPAPTLTVSATTAEPITWQPGLEAIGTVNAAQGVDLAVETSGIVERIFFSANERVTEDDLLVQLEGTVQRADLAAAQAEADLDQQSLVRALELQRRGVGTEATVDAARAAATASTAAIDRLQAVVDQKQVRAPFSGMMGIPRIERGQYIAPGDVVATLQDLDTMRADFSVPEQELPNLAIGGRIALGFSADAMTFSGTITGIEPKVDPTSRLVSVRAEIAEPQNRLTPGQFVEVRVILPEEEGVIAVPQTALVSSLYGDFVFTVQPAPQDAEAAPPAEGAGDALAVKQAFVKPGRRSGGLVEIVSGVNPGDVIVTAGQNRLSNGMQVQIDNTIDPANLSPSVAQAQ